MAAIGIGAAGWAVGLVPTVRTRTSTLGRTPSNCKKCLPTMMFIVIEQHTLLQLTVYIYYDSKLLPTL